MTTPKKSSETVHPSTGKPISDDAILKVAKEIVVKFIEVGRLSPSNVDETFREIYNSVYDTVRKK